MADVVSLLKQLGFAEYEARAYLALLRQSPLNGYELARASGVPRADIYTALQRLEQRGAALRLDTESGTRYSPVSPEELLRGLEDRFQETLDASRRSMEEVTAPPEYELVGNARGYETLLGHARGLLDGARRRLLVALSPQEAAALAGELEEADARGAEITTLCLEACPRPCGHCRGHVHRFRLGPAAPERWLIVAQDGAEVLAGEIREPAEETLSVRTRQPLLVGVAERYVENGIALATVLAELGDRLETLLSPEARDALASLGAARGKGDWLEEMRVLLAQHGTPGGE